MNATADPDLKQCVVAGIGAGLTGGVTIWAYEALVWVHVQHLMLLSDIPRNAVGLVFGRVVQHDLGVVAFFLGTLIHFFFAIF